MYRHSEIESKEKVKYFYIVALHPFFRIFATEYTK